jgi:hypothetical protein
MSETTSLRIYLDSTGDGSYHVKNDKDEVQRQHLVDRGNALMVQADLVEVVHGRLTPGGDSATLIITDFRFIPTKASRRFQSAMIIVRFSGAKSGSSDPEVVDIAPRGDFSLQPTQKKVELTRSENLSAQGGGAGVTAGAGLGWELEESYEEDQTTLAGTIRLEGREYGGKNTAKWVLIENQVQKSGLPTLLRTAILLKRRKTNYRAEERFQATIEIKADIDFVSSVEDVIDRVLGRVPKDDPVIFDPLMKPTNTNIDPDNLGRVDLKNLMACITTINLS